MSEWISMDDRLPDDGVGVLITNGAIITAAKLFPIGCHWWDGLHFSGYEWEWDFNTSSITHWMPLPEPPD